jgi:hypothetical protein
MHGKTCTGGAIKPAQCVRWVAAAAVVGVLFVLVLENVSLVHMKPPDTFRSAAGHVFDYYTLLTPPASGSLFHNEYNTTQLECWIRQLRAHSVAPENIHVLSAGAGAVRNTRGEAIARRYGVDLVQRPLLVNEHTLEKFKYQFSKLWMFNQSGYWVFLDTDLVFHRNPALCAAACAQSLRRDHTSICAVGDVFMPVVKNTYRRWGKNRYFNAGFFAARGSESLFRNLVQRMNQTEHVFRIFAEQSFLNEFFEQSSSAPPACNYRRMWYDFSRADANQIVIEHGKYGVDPRVPIPAICADLYT